MSGRPNDLIFDVPGNYPFSACNRALETGKLTPVIDRTFPLSEAREALRHMIEDEIQGKVTITP